MNHIIKYGRYAVIGIWWALFVMDKAVTWCLQEITKGKKYLDKKQGEIK